MTPQALPPATALPSAPPTPAAPRPAPAPALIAPAADSSVVPVLPESAPFTAEQRAYLNGFLAGLFSRAMAPGASPSPAAAAPPATLEPLTILFGSQTGTAEKLAKRAAKDAGRLGFAATVQEMAQYPIAQLPASRQVLMIASTYGDGEPPDNAKSFWDALAADNAPRLEQTRFAVCALGDSNYPKFCAFGKALDERLERLGAQRSHARVDCDVDVDEPFQLWLGATLQALRPATDAGSTATSSAAGPAVADRDAAPAYGRSNPYPAPLVENRRLNAPGSAKDTRHFEFSLEGSGLTYAAGDALGVFPENDPELVRLLIETLGASGDEPVPGNRGEAVPLREALTRHYEIVRIQSGMLQAFASKSGDAELARLVDPKANGELNRFLYGRDVLDLLRAHPAIRPDPATFVGLLKKLQPRLYSIASSPKAHVGQVHLCVGIVRYESLGRTRGGVCSTFLADRAQDRASVPVFVHTNPNFRPPAKGETPMILVGPGTGIAPFRGFLHERRATGATGRNWLFFGDQRAATDYLYQEELEGFHRDGFLTRIDTAFSRDQAAKVYVQDRMLEHAAELYRWLQDGAHFYVCGDASRMAKDVEAALLKVYEIAGGQSADQAAASLAGLKKEKRYQRDVY